MTKEQLRTMSRMFGKEKLILSRELFGKDNRDIADIQVIDYMLGIKNRRFGDVTVSLDIDDMLAVSESAAATIKNLTPEGLTKAMAESGMDETSINGCVNRLQELKEKINEGRVYPESINNIPSALEIGKLTVIRDKAWDDLAMEDLALDQEKEKPADQMMKLMLMVYYGQYDAINSNYYAAAVQYMYGIDIKDKTKKNGLFNEKGFWEEVKSWRENFSLESCAKDREFLANMTFSLDVLLNDDEPEDDPAAHEFKNLASTAHYLESLNSTYVERKRELTPNEMLRLGALYGRMSIDAENYEHLAESKPVEQKMDKTFQRKLQTVKRVGKDAKQKFKSFIQASKQMATEKHRSAITEIERFHKFANVMMDYEMNPGASVETLTQTIHSVIDLAKEAPDNSPLFYILKPRLDKLMADAHAADLSLGESALTKDDVVAVAEIYAKCAKVEEEILHSGSKNIFATPLVQSDSAHSFGAPKVQTDSTPSLETPQMQKMY